MNDTLLLAMVIGYVTMAVGMSIAYGVGIFLLNKRIIDIVEKHSLETEKLIQMKFIQEDLYKEKAGLNFFVNQLNDKDIKIEEIRSESKSKTTDEDSSETDKVPEGTFYHPTKGRMVKV